MAKPVGELFDLLIEIKDEVAKAKERATSDPEAREKKKRVKAGVKGRKKEDKYKSEELVYDSDSDSGEVANAVNELDEDSPQNAEQDPLPKMPNRTPRRTSNRTIKLVWPSSNWRRWPPLRSGIWLIYNDTEKISMPLH